ncbi:MAG: eL32 family ribosomal protein [Candidatus Micrarchaeia archaeon]|jgi:ribosomal protein L32E
MTASAKIVKKKKPHFKVPNLGAKNRKRVKDRWRRQRGIDNKMRVSKKFHGKSPNIGYKNAEEVRYRNREGLIEVLVHNSKELLELANKQGYAAKLYHALSARKKEQLRQLAQEKGIRLA